MLRSETDHLFLTLRKHTWIPASHIWDRTHAAAERVQWFGQQTSSSTHKHVRRYCATESMTEGGTGGLKAPSTFGYRIFTLKTVAPASCDFLSLQMAVKRAPCGVPKLTLSAQAVKSYRPYDVKGSCSPFLVFLYRVVSVKTATLHLFRFDSNGPVFFFCFFFSSYLIKQDRLWCWQLTLCACTTGHQSSEQKPDQNRNAPCHSGGSDVMRSVRKKKFHPQRWYLRWFLSRTASMNTFVPIASSWFSLNHFWASGMCLSCPTSSQPLQRGSRRFSGKQQTWQERSRSELLLTQPSF